MTSNQAKETAKATIAKSSTLRLIRYRTASIFLLVLYIAILLIPWIITCILMMRPVDRSSYFDQSHGLPLKVIKHVLQAWDVTKFFTQLQVVLAIPIVSGLLAQAAAVYTQRQSTKKKLSLQELIALANRPWADVILGLRWFSRSCFVAFGGLLILLVTVTPAIQAILVKIESIRVVDCDSAPINSCSFWNVPSSVGLDPSPSDLQYVPQNLLVQYVSKKLQQVSENDEQPYMWPDSPLQFSEVSSNEIRNTFFWYTGYDNPGAERHETYFVSSLKNGSNTGVLREHAMRFNSSIECEFTPSSAFPEVCPGGLPYETTLSAPNVYDVRICVPGAYGRTPWNLTRDRQDLTEELWIDVVIHDKYMLGFYTEKFYHATNYTQHCTARSTRGYFEVNNHWNGGNPGPLLDKWPEPAELTTEYNDFLGLGQHYGTPSASGDNDTNSKDNTGSLNSPPDPFRDLNDDNELYVPGPLMTSTLALFGNQSFFNAAGNVKNDTAAITLTLLCQLDVFPFTQLNRLGFNLPVGGLGHMCNPYTYQNLLSAEEREKGTIYQVLNGAAFNLLGLVNSTDFGSSWPLSMAMYFAHEGLLNTAASTGGLYTDARRIYYSSGAVLTKPKWSLGAVVTVSVLIGIQILSLCALMAYTYFYPRWTDTLDAFAMVRVGAQLQRSGRVDLPGIRDTDSKDLMPLKDVDGLAGVAAKGDTSEHPSPPCERSTGKR